MCKDATVELVRPTLDHLPAYADALTRGWSPDNLRPQVAEEQLARFSDDPETFIAGFDDPDAKGPPVILPDGSRVPRLPGVHRWIWQDGFCGTIGLRWQPGTEALPPHCPGHVGYAVVPWRRNRGLASAALIALLPEARAIGLRHIDITTAPENTASIRVIERAGGALIDRFQMAASLGGGECLLFRVALQGQGALTDTAWKSDSGEAIAGSRKG